jgi:hypothetical protein
MNLAMLLCERAGTMLVFILSRQRHSLPRRTLSSGSRVSELVGSGPHGGSGMMKRFDVFECERQTACAPSPSHAVLSTWPTCSARDTVVVPMDDNNGNSSAFGEKRKRPSFDVVAWLLWFGGSLLPAWECQEDEVRVHVLREAPLIAKQAAVVHVVNYDDHAARRHEHRVDEARALKASEEACVAETARLLKKAHALHHAAS